MEKLIETKRGFALCPFHSERTPSFKIFNNLWYCFGEGRGGDTIKFVMEKEGFDFRAAVRFLLKIVL